MDFSAYIAVFNNISKNFYHLINDFIEIEFDIEIVISIITNISVAALTIVVYHLIGSKIRLFLF